MNVKQILKTEKLSIFFLHCGYWLLYILLLTVFFSLLNLLNDKKFSFAVLRAFYPLFLLCLLPNLIAFYTAYFWLFPRFFVKRNYVFLTIYGVFICLFSALFGSLLSGFFYGFEQPIFLDIKEFLPLASVFFSIALIHAVVAFILKGFASWSEELKTNEELLRKNHEMETALVKSQLNPHFLFNTLNNIDVLIEKQPSKASAYLNQLSDILRYAIYQTKNEKVPLSTEIDYLSKYLELQKIRTSNPNYINFEVSGSFQNLMIAPMIFFPFVENAFKHTEQDKKLSSIDIKILVDKNYLTFECQNTSRKSKSISSENGGLGNKLIKKRLLMIYPEKHSLKIENNDEIYRVKLEINFGDNAKLKIKN